MTTDDGHSCRKRNHDVDRRSAGRKDRREQLESAGKLDSTWYNEPGATKMSRKLINARLDELASSVDINVLPHKIFTNASLQRKFDVIYKQLRKYNIR